MIRNAANLYGLLPVVQPEQMTPRARLYLLATAIYCFAMGIACAAAEERFISGSFVVVKFAMPFGLAGWALVHVLVGSIALSSLWHGGQRRAWAALIGAAGVVGPWAATFWWAFFTQPESAPTGMIAYTFITLIHIIQARQPLRSPFDPLIRGRVSDG